MYKQVVLLLYAWCMLAGASAVFGQAVSLTIEECYTLARENYPLARQRGLIGQSEAYAVETASKGNLPQISLSGQLSYQSDVPRIPIDLPGAPIPLIPKDQYKVYGELTQVIYDGGVTSLEKQGHEASARAEQQSIEVELYKLKERINQLFFGTLLINAHILQVGLLRKDIDLGLAKIQAAIDNGIALKSSAAVMHVELLKSNQRMIELEASRRAYLEMLGLLINQPLGENTMLIIPAVFSTPEEINRPEMLWFDYQHQDLSLQSDLLNVQNRPKINLFFQGGLGRPGLNIFDDELKGFYLGGIRFFWPLAGFYSVKNDRALINIHQQQIDVQRKTFLFNTQLQLRQESNEILKLEELLATDDEIVALRSTIKHTALGQLENGVITTNDYLREVNAEDSARQNSILHEIQLRMARYSLLTTLGY